MGKVLGGFKNMLNRWRINLKNKKKKDKIENEELDKVKKSRIQSFLYSCLAILYCPIGHLFSKGNISKNKVSVKKKNVKTINNDPIVKNECIKAHKQNLNVSTNQNFKSKNIDTLNVENINKKISQQNIEKTLNLKPTIQIPSKGISLNQSKDRNLQVEKNNAEKIVISESVDTIKDSILVNKSNTDNSIKIIREKYNVNEQKEVDEQIHKNSLEKLTEEVIKIVNETKLLDEKIETITKYNDLYHIQNELIYLEQQITKLQKQYNSLDIKNVQTYKFDIFELCKNDDGLKNVVKYIEDTLKNVENKKIEIFYSKKIKTKPDEVKPKENNKKVREKTNKKQEEIQKKEKQLSEFEIVHQIILKDIINQQDHLTKNIKRITNKNSLFNCLGSFIKRMLGMNLILMPFGLFKNPLLFGLANSIMVNNSLKTMRKLVNIDLEINYEMLLDSYLDDRQMILRTLQNYTDGLNQLDNIEFEINKIDSNCELLKDIQIIRTNIENEIDKIKKQNEMLDKVYVNKMF